MAIATLPRRTPPGRTHPRRIHPRRTHRRRTPSVLGAVLVGVAWALTGCHANAGPVAEAPPSWARPAAIPGVANLHRVDAHLYRSAQPTAAGFRGLAALGVRHLLDLRPAHDDRALLEDLPLEVRRVPIHAFAMTRTQLVEAVAFLVQVEGPVLVHCRHGADRTGAVVAGYRIAAHGWTKERAVDELRRGGYGFHAFFFANLPQLLLSLDEEAFRRDVRQRAESEGRATPAAGNPCRPDPSA